MGKKLENIKKKDLFVPDKKAEVVTPFFMAKEAPPLIKIKPFYLKFPFIFLVVLPIFLGALYFGVIATDRYVSHTQLTVRSAENGSPNMLTGLVGAISGGAATTTEAYIVKDYIQSRDILVDLQAVLNLRSIYGIADADYLSRLAPDATNEELYEHYLDRIAVNLDTDSQIIDVKVEAFSPDDAQLIAESIIFLCDNLVNWIAQKSREDALKYTYVEIKRAEKRVEAARMALNAFRQMHGELDPMSSAIALGNIVARIEADLATVQTEHTALRSYLRENSPQLITVKALIAALQKQLALARKRLAGPQAKGTFIPILAEYERLKIEDEFAKTTYMGAATALELARVEANRKHLYLVAFVKPSLPDDALQPERAKMILTIVVVSLLVYGLVLLISATIREHARV